MAIKQELWDKAKVLFELGKSLHYINEVTEINKGSISRKAKKEGWKKAELQPLKVEAKGLNDDIATINQKTATLIQKVAKLSDFEITILDEVIQDEQKGKNLIFSNTNLALIRSNQQLTKGTKKAMTKVKQYNGSGQVCGEQIELYEIELDPKDIREHIELTDKASITLGVNQRHAPKIDVTQNQATQVNQNLKVSFE